MSRPSSLVAPGNWQPSKADSSLRTEDIEVLMRATGERGRTPAVTVLTNIAGAVSVSIDRATSINAGRRLRSMVLPDNPFNPFRSREKTQSIPSQIDGTAAAPLLRAEITSERSQPMSSSSRTTAADRVTSITRGVRKALQQWAVRRSRRQCMTLWKHGCSEYASPSRLGHHPNHLGIAHPGSRPASAITALRPFSVPRKEEMASSAAPLRSRANVEVRNANGRHGSLNHSDEQGGPRPWSAVPRLSEWPHTVTFDDNEEQEEPQTSTKFSASGWEGGISVGSNDRCGHVWRGGIAAEGEKSTQQSGMQEEDEVSSREQVEGNYGEIYEDLDDEDDDELDNRISVMETRFTRLGRERPISATCRDGISMLFGDESDVPLGIRVSSAPRSPSWRPPRAPQRGAIDAVPNRRGWARIGIVRDTKEWRPPRVMSGRPTSAPADGSLLGIHRRPDPMAALHARRMKLRMSSADGEELRPAGGAQNGASDALDPQQEWQRKKNASRDVTTAVPSWESDIGGGGRPLSSSTIEITGERYTSRGVDQYYRQITESVASSRSSSAAFRRWIETRPSARSLVSAISSTRTVGLDDPELVHLQIELESRRGGQSDATLARIEDHYNAIMRKNEPLHKKSRGGSKRYRTPCPARSRKVDSRGIPRSKGSSRGTRKRSAARGKRKKRPASSRRGRSPSKGRGKIDGTEVSSVPKKVYPSAKAFIADHFPSEDEQGVSLLGMEQEMECRRAFAVLSRAGVLVSGETLRRALVIPTDRPLEACLAGLPLPMEGLRHKPFPPGAPNDVAFARRAPSSFRAAGVISVDTKTRPKPPPKQSKRTKSPFRKGGKIRVGIGSRAGERTG